jgi:hypothetical protein
VLTDKHSEDWNAKVIAPLWWPRILAAPPPMAVGALIRPHRRCPLLERYRAALGTDADVHETRPDPSADQPFM